MTKYFGYTHGDGKKLEVKAYQNQWNLQKYIDDPFIIRVYGPFKSTDKDHALLRLKKLIKHDTCYAKKK